MNIDAELADLKRHFELEPGNPLIKERYENALKRLNRLPVTLKFLTGKREGDSLLIPEGSVNWLVGNKRDAEISIRDPWVSFKHTYISHVNQQVTATDSTSAGGTWLNGRRITMKNQPVNDGDYLYFGKTKTRVHYGFFIDPEIKDALETNELKLPRPGRVTLEFLSGVRIAESIVIPEGSENWLVGNSRKAEISIRDPWISFKHALINFSNGRFTVADFNSVNGTWRDGRRLIKGATEIKHGDLIYFGKTKVRVSITES